MEFSKNLSGLMLTDQNQTVRKLILQYTIENPTNSLEERLSYSFNNKENLSIAITRHAAILEGHAFIDNYDLKFSRYKFFGARILSLLVADLLFTSTLFISEGSLTKGFEQLFQREGLIVSRAAKNIQLGECLLLGRSEALQYIQGNSRVLLTHMQAIFGAMWFDSQ